MTGIRSAELSHQYRSQERIRKKNTETQTRTLEKLPIDSKSMADDGSLPIKKKKTLNLDRRRIYLKPWKAFLSEGNGAQKRSGEIEGGKLRIRQLQEIERDSQKEDIPLRKGLKEMKEITG